LKRKYLHLLQLDEKNPDALTGGDDATNTTHDKMSENIDTDEARYGTGPDPEDVEVGDVLQVYFDGQVLFEPREFEGEVVRTEREGAEKFFELSCGEEVNCVRGTWFYMNLGTRRVELADGDSSNGGETK